MKLAQTQTAPALWFDKAYSTIYPALNDCPGAVPFERYKTVNHSDGITYLCHAPDKEDTITEVEMRSLRALAERLGATHSQTLANYEAATYLKTVVQTYSKTPSGSQ